MTDSRALDLEGLRDKAERAARVWDGLSWRPDEFTVARADVDVLTARSAEVAEFCEAFDPPMVLRLLDDLERLRGLNVQIDQSLTEPTRITITYQGATLVSGYLQHQTVPEDVNAVNLVVDRLS